MGIRFGKFGGSFEVFCDWFHRNAAMLQNCNIEEFVLVVLAFLDDIYLVCKALQEAQAMVNDISRKLAEVGLSLNLAKVKWMCNEWAGAQDSDYLEVDGVRIFQVDSMCVLGVVISIDGSEDNAADYRSLENLPQVAACPLQQG